MCYVRTVVIGAPDQVQPLLTPGPQARTMAATLIEKGSIMSFLLKRGAASALVLVFATQGAWAEISADEVWADWVDYLTGAGYDLSVTENRSGDTLTITDLALSMDFVDPGTEQEGTFSIMIPEISLTEQGGGTVSVGMPARMPVTIDGEADGEDMQLVLDYAQTDMSLIISGEPDDMTYDYSAASAQITLASLMVEGNLAPDNMLDLSVTMTNLRHLSQMAVGTMRSVEQTMAIESVEYAVSFDDPESDDNGLVEGRLVDVTFEGKGDLPLEMDPEDMRAMLDSGLNFDGTFSYGGGKTHIKGSGDGESVRLDSNSESGVIQFALNPRNLIYDLTQTGVNIEMESGELPFPVAMAMAKAATRLVMPVAESDETQDFALSVTLSDFVMSDMIWMMFDAGQVLPRDPASIMVDLTGKAKLFFDVFDPEDAIAMEDDAMPGELEQLSVNNLLVSAAGTELTGKGDFTFDNADLTSFDGMPRPEGELNLQLVGANALLDRLMQMGFVSDEEAMQARMMMGMFAAPGDGADTLKSNIVVNEQGHVLINGQRIK